MPTNWNLDNTTAAAATSVSVADEPVERESADHASQAEGEPEETCPSSETLTILCESKTGELTSLSDTDDEPVPFEPNSADCATEAGEGEPEETCPSTETLAILCESETGELTSLSDADDEPVPFEPDSAGRAIEAGEGEPEEKSSATGTLTLLFERN